MIFGNLCEVIICCLDLKCCLLLTYFKVKTSMEGPILVVLVPPNEKILARYKVWPN
jgi:hypothetical protein